MAPRVSIITAVRDGARTIAETIASVQAQSEPAWEHLIVDDGSSDATAAVVAASADERLRYVREQPAGRSVARNRGIELATGEWLLFLDADDWLEPDALRDHLELTAHHREYEASIGDGWFCTEAGEPIVRFAARRAPVAPGDILAPLVANPGLYGAPLAVMVRAAAVRRHGVRFDPALAIGEDNRFFLELARHVQVGFVDSVTCRYRWHAQSTTRRASAAERNVQLWHAVRGVTEFPEFAGLSAGVREQFFFRALIEWLGDRPDEQVRLFESAPFGQLPAQTRARLLRLAASEHLLGARHGAAAALARRAAALAPGDATLAVLRVLMSLHPRLAALAVWARRRMAGREADALWQFPQPGHTPAVRETRTGERGTRNEARASVLVPRSVRMAELPPVLVVVLNWHSADDTLACLAALARSTYPRQRVLVVDNGSRDRSLETIRAARPDVEILALPENHGYAGGNNRGIVHGRSDCAYVWLLNPDTVVAPDCLTALVEAGERDSDIGFLGPLLLMREDPTRVLSAGGLLVRGWSRHRGAGERDGGQFSAAASVDYVMGCALLARRRMIDTVGLLDERYFLYGEEADWCRRARQAGFTSVVVPSARAWHPNTAVRDAESPRVTYYMARNQLRFVREHRLGVAVLARHLLRHLRTLFSWSLRPKWRHKRAQRQALRRALVDFARGRSGAAPDLDAPA